MLERVKKLNVIIICMIILITSMNLSVLVENINLSNLSIFSSSQNSDIYENKTLIITSKTNDFKKFGAEDVSVENGVYILKYKNEKDTKRAYKKIQESGEVVSVEVNASIKIQETKENNTVKNAYETEKTELSKYLESNKTEEKEIKVAIIDTGIDVNNKLFEGRIIDLKTNLSTSGEANSIKDDNGHGTELASIIAKNTNKNVKLMPIKIANSKGKASVLDAYNAIKIAIENKANIINISMNTYKTKKSKILENIIKEAIAQGIQVVVSAGNNNMNVKNVVPANIENAITVSAINEDNTFASYSNYGETIDFSTYGTYEGKTGTSYATANITSIIAELLSKGEEIETLNQYTIDLGKIGRDDYYGIGFIGKTINKSNANTEIIEHTQEIIPEYEDEEELTTSGTGENTFYTLVDGLIGNYRLNYIGNVNYVMSSGGPIHKDSNSSSATLVNDGGYSIARAYLVWNTTKPANPGQAITLSANGRSISVNPSNIYNDVRINATKSHYRMSGDVTSFVKTNGYTTYTVSNIPINKEIHDGERISTWQLIVIEENINEPVRIIKIQEGAKFTMDQGDYIPMQITLPSGYRTKATGNATGQIMMGYMSAATDKKLYISVSNIGNIEIRHEPYLWKDNKNISDELYLEKFNLIKTKMPNGTNSFNINVNNSDGSWCTLFNMGVAVDLDMPTFTHRQTASINGADKQVLTLSGSITNTNSSAGSGIRNGVLTISIDNSLRIENIKANNVQINGKNFTATKINDNTIQVNLNGVDWYVNQTLNYTIDARVVRGAGKNNIGKASGYIGGTLLANYNDTGYRVGKIAEANSEYEIPYPAGIENIKLTVNPNGGIWNGSSSVQNVPVNYGQSIQISNPQRNAYTFKGWTLVGQETGSSINRTTFTMGYRDASITAGWSLNTKNINGQVNWQDQNNKYSSRPVNVQVTLHHDKDGNRPTIKEPDKNPVIVAGNANYTFTNVQTQKESNNSNYNYSITQNVVPGYKTTVDGGQDVANINGYNQNAANKFNITNTLIVPTYTSSITYTPIDTFQNKLLKNGKVKLTATATTTQSSDERAGLHNGTATFTIDNGIKIDTSKIKISFYDASTKTTTNLNNYQISNNVITENFGTDSNGISEKGDKIIIETEGTLNKIGNYSSELVITGKLRDVSINSGLTQEKRNTPINLGEVTRASNNQNAQENGKTKIEYQMPQANIKIIKYDSITEQNLTNATFTLYEWNGSTYIEKETIKDTNGDGIYESKYYEWNKITNGKYKIVETGIPENHKNLNFSMIYTLNQLKPQNYTITPDYDNKEYTITYGVRKPDDFDNTNGIVENEPYKIKAKIDILDSETLNQIQNEATFKIYEWDNTKNDYKLYTSYTNGKEVKMIRQQDKTYIAGEWLYYTKINEGKYRIVEETAPTGYYGDYSDDNAQTKRTYDINVLDLVGTNGQTNEMTITLSNSNNGQFTNRRTKSEIKLNKVDSQTKGEAQADATLEGAVYEIYAKNNIHHADGITSNYQGETALLYKANELITTKETNAEGKITFENLECGTYYIKEKTPSEGYLLDKETHEVEVEYRGQSILTVKEERTYEEKVKKQGFQIYKIKQTDRTEYEGLQNAGFTIYRINTLSIVKDGKISKNVDGSYNLHDEQAKKDKNLTKLANKNGTYNIIDLIDYYYKIKYTEDNMEQLPQNENSYFAYNINEEKVKDYSSDQNGKEIQELLSNGDGYIRSPELAYGEYIVIETTTPKNLETAKPFYINIENDSRTPQKLKFIVDANFETKVKIYKKDIDTGKNVLQAGTKYVIYNEENKLMTVKTWDATNGYVEYGTLEHPFTTGNEGYLVTPMKLPVGNYTLKEVEAPNGYVVNGHEGHSQNGQTIEKPNAQVTFRISTSGIYYTDDYLDTSVIVVNQQNKTQVGTITITTNGEFVNEATKDDKGNYNFTYETRPIQGVTYQIKAKENITTKDGHNTIMYNKDEIVKTVTSNKDGIAYAENLPQGKYYIVQTVAGNGFTINKEQKEFEITYGTNNKQLPVGTKEWKTSSQETPVIYLEENYTNQRQNLKITINKQDGETKEPIQGTTIGLYAKENIQNIKTNQTIIPKDTLIQAHETNEQGQIIIEGNIPLNNYYVKEIKASHGYIKNNQINNIDGTYDITQIPIKEINTTLTNYKTNINIEKTDIEGTKLSGATLELKDSQANIVESWITEEQVKNIKGLKTNEEYSIIEAKPAPGYATTNPIKFTITEAGIVQTEGKHENNTITMQDETTKLRVELLDKETKEYVSEAVLKIVKIKEETDQDGNKQTKEEEVAKWTTTKESYNIEKLEIGHYKLIEETAPIDQGYVKVEAIEFDIKDTKEIQTIQMLQERTKLQIALKDKDTKEQVEGATLQIIRRTKQTDENGNEQTKEEVIREFKTTNQAYYTEKLPVGTYTIRETVTPTEKGYATIEDKEIQIIETKEIQEVEIEQEVTKLQVKLQDKDTSEQIQGATLQIIKQDTKEVIREFETTGEPYYTEKIPTGKYILKQIKSKQEEGQVTAKEIEFEIIDTREIQVVTMIQDYTKLEIEVVDKETKEKVQGAKFEIYKVIEKEEGTKEKGEKVREFTTREENYQTTRLGIGKYVLVELPNQKESLLDKGYATLEDTYFDIKDTAETQKITVEQDHTKLEIEVVDKETKEKVQGAKFEIYKVIEKEEGTKEKGEKVREFTTGKENYQTTKLGIGKYVLVELPNQKESLLDKGYTTLEDTYFEIKDTAEIQKLIVEQDHTKLEIEVLDKETKEKLEGIKFEIYKVVTKENGTEEKGEKVREFETEKENYKTIKLGVGKYILHELPNQKENLLDKGYVTLEDINFEIKDTAEIQKITVEQTISKLEIQIKDKETGKNVSGVTIEIIKRGEDGKEEKIKEVITIEENTTIEKLAIGEYILRQKEEGITNKGYIRTEDIHFKIEDTLKTQKVEVELDYTKLEIKVVDKETKETILGATMVITDKEGNEITDRWISTKDTKEIKKLPVGEYYIEEKEAPTLKGYVKTEKIEIKVEEKGEIQKYEFEQDYTKVQIKVVDEETKEEIKEGTVIIKDEKGNKVGEIKLQEEQTENKKETEETKEETIQNIIKRIPVGKYTVEGENLQYGYKQIKGQIEIKDKEEIQKYTVIAEREEFDIEVKEWIGSIKRNGTVQYTNKKEEQSVKKIDIKDKKIKTEDIRITYKIRVKNISKITGQVGKVEVTIPQGMKYVGEDNRSYWKQEGGKIVTTGIAGRDLKEGAYAEIEITLRWKNGLENFGTKAAEVEIKEIKSNIGFKESNKENNKAKASDIIIGVSTGEMNLVWACWILLITLVLVEIYVTKKLHIKVFKIKDKTLKYRNKK